MTNVNISKEIKKFGNVIDSRIPASDQLKDSEWLMKYMTDPKHPFRKFSFEGREFFIDIIDDPRLWLCMRKSAQIGGTELFTRAGVRYCVKYGRIRIIYTMPSKTDIETYSADRFNTMIADLEKTFPVSGDVSNTSLKQILEAYIYFRGTKSATAPISIPADILIHDEIDKSDMDAISQYSSRIENSDIALVRYFSTPTFSSFGIDKMFKQSDQAWYLHKCYRCNEWVCFMPEDMKRVGGIWQFTCPKCDRVIDKTQTKKEWVRKFPERKDKAGYQVGKIWSGVWDAESIKKSEERYKNAPDATQHIHNYVYGLPYDSAELVPFPFFLLEKATKEEEKIDRSYGCLIGIDNSVAKHVVVLDVRQGYWVVIEAFVTDSDGIYLIKDAISKYNPFFCGIDPLPDITFAKMVRELMNKVYYVWYRNVTNLSDVDEKELKITLHKNLAVNELSTAMKEGRLFISDKVLDEQYEILEHFNNIKGEKDKEGNVKYTNMGMADHFAMATIYALAGHMSSSHNSFMVGVDSFKVML